MTRNDQSQNVQKRRNARNLGTEKIWKGGEGIKSLWLVKRKQKGRPLKGDKKKRRSCIRGKKGGRRSGFKGEMGQAEPTKRERGKRLALSILRKKGVLGVSIRKKKGKVGHQKTRGSLTKKNGKRIRKNK